MNTTSRVCHRGVWYAAVLALVMGCRGDVAGPGPDPGTVHSIDVSAGTVTLTSLNETTQLTAVGRNAAGGTISNVAFTWSSSAPDVLAVDGSGNATAVSNGAAIVTAASGTVTGTATVVVEQRAATAAVLEGDGQGGTVGTPLEDAVVVELRDALGSIVPGGSVTFAASHGGAADPATATADAAGRASTSWTLGTAAGMQELDALPSGNAVDATLSAMAFADLPSTLALIDGDGQSELPGMTLPAPIRVLAMDAHGNPVPELPVVFTTGTGTLHSAEVLTDLDGIAAAQWTLGASMGAHSAQASLPDSVLAEPGSVPAVAFAASAVAFAVTGVADAAVSRQEMTVTGSGFHPDPASNVVTVGGSAAEVTGGTQHTLTVAVPDFGCTPAQARDIVVTRGTQSGTTSALVRPHDALDLAVGATRVLTDPSAFCLQFMGNGTGGTEYVIGVTSTRAVEGLVPFTLVADDGTGSRQPSTPMTMPEPTQPVRSAADDELLRRRALLDREARLFAMPRRPRPAAPRAGHAASIAYAAASPVPGEAITFRVPRLATDPCREYTEVVAKVVYVGPSLVVATDAAVPEDAISTTLINQALTTLHAVFAGTIRPAVEAHFGALVDLAGDGRIALLLSPTVGEQGVSVFTSAVDHLGRDACAASDERAVIYATVPQAPTAAQLAALAQELLPPMARELTHVVQQSRRVSAGGVPLAGWLAEAAAEIGTEVAGMAVRGDVSGNGYGADVVMADAVSARWYRPRFDRLSYLFGWDGQGGSVAGAPERCSLFGFGGLAVTCRPAYAQGAAWSFLRFVADRMAAHHASGDAGFLRQLVDSGIAGDGTDALTQLTGATLAELTVDWAMMLYADGRLPAGAAPSLQLTSWDLNDIYSALPAAQSLAPAGFGMAGFQRAGSVMGGGTAYTRVTAAGAHDALAVRLRDASDRVPGATTGMVLWVMRVQ